MHNMCSMSMGWALVLLIIIYKIYVCMHVIDDDDCIQKQSVYVYSEENIQINNKLRSVFSIGLPFF